LYNQVIYKLSLGQAPISTVTGGNNYFSDHFELILFLFAPLRFIFGTYTLIWIQSFFLIIGALGFKNLLIALGGTERESQIISLTFLISFTVFMAVECEYHSNVIGCCLVPWLLLFIKKEKYTFALLSAIFILICRENCFLIIFITLFPLLFEKVFAKKQILFGTFILLLSCAYFFFIVKLVMPNINAEKINEYQHLSSYSNLNLKSYLNFFSNVSGQHQYDYFKFEFIAFSLISGLAITVFRPLWFISFLPIMFQKFLHHDPLKWGINFHYGIDGIWVILLGVFFSVRSLELKYKANLFLLILFSNLALTIRCMDNGILKRDKCKLRLYKKCHYSRGFDLAKAHRFIEKEGETSLGFSTQENILPHLAFRENIRIFPDTVGSNFIIYNLSEMVKLPISNESFYASFNDLIKTQKFQFYKTDNNWVELKRK
jgi:uncharacterized membrane protein